MAEAKKGESLSGMTDEEAQEFHRIFMTSFIIFTVVALIAHLLAWNWRSWLPSEDGYAMFEGAVQTVNSLFTLVA